MQVRWADLEQRRAQARGGELINIFFCFVYKYFYFNVQVSELGFVVGQTNWASREDRERAASRALTDTKIIPNRFHSEFHN